MMQWGIVNGNDPYLYGEKLKAYLIRGARSLPGETVYPNERLGYGALCLERSLGQFTRNYTQTTKRGLLTTNKG